MACKILNPRTLVPLGRKAEKKDRVEPTAITSSISLGGHGRCLTLAKGSGARGPRQGLHFTGLNVLGRAGYRAATGRPLLFYFLWMQKPIKNLALEGKPLQL